MGIGTQGIRIGNLKLFLSLKQSWLRAGSGSVDAVRAFVAAHQDDVACS